MADLIGKRLGQYEILSVLGEGGMAVVYRARQVNVNRDVAVKVINKNLEVAENFVARFSREAQTIAQLSHPHILKLFDYGQEGSTVFLVTEMLSGGTLYDLIKQGALPLSRIDELLNQTASALQYAHEQGLVHRDLKPQNVLLDSRGNAYLTDFGLAKTVADATRLTQSGIAMGTPAYMSPEAWKGEPVDSRSDIYSLGVMLYEMLTGDLPFRGDSAVQLMYAHLTNPPPHLGPLSPLSAQIDPIIQRALAKSPADRPASAVEIASAFHSALGDDSKSPLPLFSTAILPQAASNPTKSAPALPTVKGRGSLLITGGIVVLVLLLIAGVAILGRSTGTQNSPLVPAADVVQVTPVAADENMVLVAQPEQVGKQPRDVMRFVVQNLTDTLDTGVPFSKLRIREYPKVITTADQARAAAKVNHAWVVVWGSVGDDAIDLQVQVGDLGVLKLNKIPEDVIRRDTDVHVRLTDPQVQSVAVPVLAVMDALEAADGNAYENARVFSLLDELKNSGSMADVIGNSVSAQITRNLPQFVSDTQKFVDQMQPIIDLDSSSPLPYIYRSLAYFRLQQFDQGLQDIQTAQRLAPEGWIPPIFLLAIKDFVDHSYDSSIKRFDRIIQLNPKDWYSLVFRATLYYLSGKFDQARADVDASIAQEPNSNAPYTLGVMLAIRQGRIGDAKALLKTILVKFPDPFYLERIGEATLGDPDSSKMMLGLLYSASDNLFLGQYAKVLVEIAKALKIDPTVPDMYLIQGFAYCNLSRWKEAEDAYTQGLQRASDYAVLYALRAEVRKEQGDLLGALSDIQAMQKIKGSEELTAMINSAANGGPAVSCKNFFAVSTNPAAPVTPDK